MDTAGANRPGLQLTSTPSAYALEITSTDDTGLETIKSWLKSHGMPIGVHTYGAVRRTNDKLTIITITGEEKIKAGQWLVLFMGHLQLVSAKVFGLMRDGIVL